MQITLESKDATLVVTLEGRLDSLSAPELESNLIGQLESVNELTLELTKLEYVSSAGLRSILLLHKTLDARKGKFILRNATSGVMDILEMTGFSSFLCIENSK